MAFRMDLVTITHVVKIVAAAMAVLWAIIVLFDVTVAQVSGGKVLLHIFYVALSLAVLVATVLIPPKLVSSASDARQASAARQSN